MSTQRGRIPPPEACYSPERIAQARAIKTQCQGAMEASAATLPARITLVDGRVLMRAEAFAGGYAYRCNDGLAVIASYDPTPHGTLLHLSASYAKRLPRWKDLTLLRDAFFPANVDVIQVLPRQGEYVNAHQFCLHLFQAPAAWEGGWNV